MSREEANTALLPCYKESSSLSGCVGPFTFVLFSAAQVSPRNTGSINGDGINSCYLHGMCHICATSLSEGQDLFILFPPRSIYLGGIDWVSMLHALMENEDFFLTGIMRNWHWKGQREKKWQYGLLEEKRSPEFKRNGLKSATTFRYSSEEQLGKRQRWNISMQDAENPAV